VLKSSNDVTSDATIKHINWRRHTVSHPRLTRLQIFVIIYIICSMKKHVKDGCGKQNFWKPAAWLTNWSCQFWHLFKKMMYTRQQRCSWQNRIFEMWTKKMVTVLTIIISGVFLNFTLKLALTSRLWTHHSSVCMYWSELINKDYFLATMVKNEIWIITKHLRKKGLQPQEWCESYVHFHYQAK
jgi:hypothetical protein